MKCNIRILIILVTLLLPQFASQAYAIVDPLSVPNNIFGVHILFTSELNDAAKLINSNGGDWGYVTIPIQSGDKDLAKWQKFMDEAKVLHIIPLIRLATEGDYFENAAWRKPEFADVLDFANFLSSLDWPVTNRYIIVFNEPNRADEWGGEVNPGEYAQILSYAAEVFKAKSQDFFIISAGLDNAAENIKDEFRNQYTFMHEMYAIVPSVFGKVDAIASHSYPNPGFRQPPSVLTKKSISSFIYEKRLADLLGDKELPVFITETGWSKNEVSQSLIASYYKEAIDSVWSDKSIIGITPFLLTSGTGIYSQFSLTKENGEQHMDYESIKEISKIKGEPMIIRSSNHRFVSKKEKFLTRNFSDHKQSNTDSVARGKAIIAAKLVKWLLGI